MALSAPVRDLCRTIFILFLSLAALYGSEPGAIVQCPPVAKAASQDIWLAADFDGDAIVDLVRVTMHYPNAASEGFRVDLFKACPGSLSNLVSLVPRVGLALRAQDVDNDDDLDVVLRDPFATRTIGIWINDGLGSFSEAEPSAFAGTADDELILADRRAPIAISAGLTSRKYSSNASGLASAAVLFIFSSFVGLAAPVSGTPGSRETFWCRGPPPFSANL